MITTELLLHGFENISAALVKIEPRLWRRHPGAPSEVTRSHRELDRILKVHGQVPLRVVRRAQKALYDTSLRGFAIRLYGRCASGEMNTARLPS